MYVFDTSPLSTLFRNYYRSRFPSLWSKFDELVKQGQLSSTREVHHEINDGPDKELIEWAEINKTLFSTPNANEARFVAAIYQVAHFQQNIEQKKILKGGRNADPFVIAKAACEGKTVITMEQFKSNGSKIPNICAHFNVRCLTLESFMAEQNWTF